VPPAGCWQSAATVAVVTAELYQQRDPWVVTTADLSLLPAAILPHSVPWNQRLVHQDMQP